MKEILDQMEEHIAEIRNLQRNFDFHSKRLESLMRRLVNPSVRNPGANGETGSGEEKKYEMQIEKSPTINNS